MSFETSMKRLEELSEKIRDEETSLDEAIKCYEEGMQCYKECSEILNNAKQKIETFSE
ncbi:MAG: exodeoxyribonuclease VII small subunit [Anaerovoracaceae bacterium]|nr:exodeoxyribonuclease VII small subunit [Bacillota bacterium]MDY5771471.1 exodeoxyribonuclease VII small subunit [Anaerovoracaceae bacterium]